MGRDIVRWSANPRKGSISERYGSTRVVQPGVHRILLLERLQKVKRGDERCMQPSTSASFTCNMTSQPTGFPPVEGIYALTNTDDGMGRRVNPRPNHQKKRTGSLIAEKERTLLSRPIFMSRTNRRLWFQNDVSDAGRSPPWWTRESFPRVFRSETNSDCRVISTILFSQAVAETH